MIALIIDLLGMAVLLGLTALAIPILRHYLIVWIDEYRSAKKQTRYDQAQPESNSAGRLSCPLCHQGQVIEDNYGGLCRLCGAEFSLEQLKALRRVQASAASARTTGNSANSARTAHTMSQSETSHATTQQKRIDLVLDGVKIGWLETYFVPFLGKLRQGPVNAYYLPDPLEPENGEFIGYFSSLDKAHLAVEKAYFKAQNKQARQKGLSRSSKAFKSRWQP